VQQQVCDDDSSAAYEIERHARPGLTEVLTGDYEKRRPATHQLCLNHTNLALGLLPLHLLTQLHLKDLQHLHYSESPDHNLLALIQGS
jgi:hypothetical protein